MAGSTKSVKSRSRSVSPPGSTSEVTSLLPSSRPKSPQQHLSAQPGSSGASTVTGHNRKISVSGRSVISNRNYGAVHRPSPTEQAPRVSQKGQRRILTTIPLQILFFLLVILTFASLVLSLLLFVNTATDLSAVALPYRGSGFAEFWFSVVGSWIGLGGVLFFSHPSVLYFHTTMLTLIIHFPILLLILLNHSLRRKHSPLFLVPFGLTFGILVVTLLSNYLVRRARWKESQKVRRMLTEAAARERHGDESGARAAVGLERGVCSSLLGFLSGVFGLAAGLASLILVGLLLFDLSITAYDASVDFPSPASRFVDVRSNSAWPVRIQISCFDSTLPENSTSSVVQSGKPNHSPKKPTRLPTILYEPSSGIPGSLALLDTPLPPSSGGDNPGNWIVDLQKRGEVGRICIWDRPGYGFSDVLQGASLGSISDALYEGLKSLGEVDLAKKSGGFVLVGEGYGGLLTRIFASRHPRLTHSFLHLDAQTALTYFNESPKGRSAITLSLHRITTRLLPSLLTPLSFTRLPSLLLHRSNSLSRILASSYPLPNTSRLNENLLKARLQEAFNSHSHTSTSFRDLLESNERYPKDARAIVLSSNRTMSADADWAEGQRGLAEEVTSDEGLVDWIKVDGVGHRVCEGHGKKVCERALRRLLSS